MRTVTSIKDEGFLKLNTCAKQATTGAESIVLDSVPLLEAAVGSGADILAVMWDERFVNEDYAVSLNAILEQRNIDVMCGTHHQIRRLEVSQGTPACVFAIKQREILISPSDRLSDIYEKFIVLLDVMDPMNVGTISRHAEAFGYRVIAAGTTVPTVSRQVIRSSTGSALRKPYYRWTGSAEELKTYLEENGYQMITTSAHATQPVTELKWSQYNCIIVGNESRGIPVELRHEAKYDVTIPMMPGGVHSINVATASSIMMYTGMLATCPEIRKG